MELVPWGMYFNTTQDALGGKGRGGMEQVSESPRSADGYSSVRVGTSFPLSLARTPIPGASPQPSSYFRTVAKCTEAMDTCFLLFFIFLHCSSVFLDLSHFLSSPCGLP